MPKILRDYSAMERTWREAEVMVRRLLDAGAPPLAVRRARLLADTVCATLSFYDQLIDRAEATILLGPHLYDGHRPCYWHAGQTFGLTVEREGAMEFPEVHLAEGYACGLRVGVAIAVLIELDDDEARLDREHRIRQDAEQAREVEP